MAPVAGTASVDGVFRAVPVGAQLDLNAMEAPAQFAIDHEIEGLGFAPGLANDEAAGCGHEQEAYFR